MNGITLVINGQDFSPVVSKYTVKHVPECETEIKTMNGEIHRFGEDFRTEIVFSLIPLPNWYAVDEEALMQRPLTVKFFDRKFNTVRTADFNIDSEQSYDFLLRNCNGDDVYKTASITLRGIKLDSSI